MAAGPGSWQKALSAIYAQLGATGDSLGMAIDELEKSDKTKSVAAPLRKRFDAWMGAGSERALSAFADPSAAAAAVLSGVPELVGLTDAVARAYARAESPDVDEDSLVDELVGNWTAPFVGCMVCAAVAASGDPELLATMPNALLAAAALRDFTVLSEGMQDALGEYCMEDLRIARLAMRFFVSQSVPAEQTDAALELVLNVDGVEGVRVQHPETWDTVLHMAVANTKVNSWVRIVCASGLLALGADLSLVNKKGKTVVQLAVILDGLVYNFFTRCIVASIVARGLEEAGVGQDGDRGGGGGGANAEELQEVRREVSNLRSELSAVRQEMKAMRAEVSTILLSFGQLLKVAPASVGPVRAQPASPKRPPGHKAGRSPRTDADAGTRSAPSRGAPSRGAPSRSQGGAQASASLPAGGGASKADAGRGAAATAKLSSSTASNPPKRLAPVKGGGKAAHSAKLAPIGAAAGGAGGAALTKPKVGGATPASTKSAPSSVKQPAGAGAATPASAPAQKKGGDAAAAGAGDAPAAAAASSAAAGTAESAATGAQAAQPAKRRHSRSPARGRSRTISSVSRGDSRSYVSRSRSGSFSGSGSYTGSSLSRSTGSSRSRSRSRSRSDVGVGSGSGTASLGDASVDDYGNAEDMSRFIS